MAGVLRTHGHIQPFIAFGMTARNDGKFKQCCGLTGLKGHGITKDQNIVKTLRITIARIPVLHT